MKTKILTLFLLFTSISAGFMSCNANNNSATASVINANSNESIFDFTLLDIDGKEVSLSKYKGKVIVIINTASQCGLVGQFAEIEAFYQKYKDKGVVVLGFPANNFLWQEPGTNEEIAAFCEKNYGVKFQMFEKVSVKGRDQHPLYQWLEAKTGKKPDWNFAKYLVSEDGTQVTFFNSSVQPMDESIISRIN